MYGQNGLEDNIMAYAKFTPRNPSVATSYDLRDMMYSIQDFVLGQNWKTDGKANGTTGFNGPAGTSAGTFPTSGNYYSTAPTGAGADGQFTFYKKHYAHAQFTSAPALKFVLRADANDGWRIHAYDKNGANISPNTNPNTGIGGHTSVGYNGVPSQNGGYGYSLDSVHIICNDTTFAIKIVSGGSSGENTPTTIDHGWTVITDLEYSPTIDLWAHGVDPTYCPTAFVHTAWQNSMSNPTPSASGANYCHFGVVQPRYIDAGGTVRTGYTSPLNGMSHMGSYSLINERWSTFDPSPAFRQDGFATAGTDTPAHMLVPCTFIGQQRMSLANGTSTGDLHKNPRRGRMMNFYRTTDDCAVDGAVIVEGSTRYRIMKPHMTGDYRGYIANVKACYAFPEDNVPYA